MVVEFAGDVRFDVLDGVVGDLSAEELRGIINHEWRIAISLISV